MHLSCIASILAGGDCIDDTAILESPNAQVILGQIMPAPSRFGVFLRSFETSDIADVERVAALLLKRAWLAGAGPGDESLTIDVDSTICQVYGNKKEGAYFGYTKVRGYNPHLAAVGKTGDILGIVTREGNANTARGAGEFVTQVINNARAAGATGEITMRFDSGFFSRAVRDAASAGDVRICITTRMSKRLKGIISDIQEDAWTSIVYWLEGGADVAEVKYRAFARDRQDVRLIVRRVKPTPGSQLALFSDYDYHAFITDRQGETLFLEADHRAHAQIELVIKDLKGGSRWNHVPSRYKNANAVWLALVWLAIGAIAHNLARCNCTTWRGATAQPGTVQLHNLARCNCTTWHGATAQPGTVQLHNLARCNCTTWHGSLHE
ncbi:IS1380 family transposase [Acidithrix sp. C25]|uniref:IS1380 family transposase n=1 Tax=Acidithrix sp. C25 TaxID=1671482 RepID=UPI00191BAAE6|nr:IS1380 family transposase [Acidithrix sp. C25]CAG4900746.1 unnamed protein product [Acidithrix sp. C25]